MPATRWIAGAAALALGAVVVAGPTPPAAAAATTCVAHASLPARVTLDHDAVVVRTELRGSSACHHQRTDNGATANLHRPGEQREQLRWSSFDTTQRVKLYVNIDHTGRYRIGSGDVQVYKHDYEQVDYRWRPTSTIVKHGGRFVHTTAHAGTVSGRAERYTKFGWRGYDDAVVHLQTRRHGAWRSVAHRRADSRGQVAFAVHGARPYRLSFTKSPRVWGARSGTVAG